MQNVLQRLWSSHRTCDGPELRPDCLELFTNSCLHRRSSRSQTGSRVRVGF